ncbi:MAG: hypothetical protein K2J71_01095, partial [Oscillospiraceae bacterium]|nr:hypothetical protein [Oscillospiraceae bacterium]
TRMNDNSEKDIKDVNEMFEDLFKLLDDISDKKQNDIANEKINDDSESESFEEFIKEMEAILGCSLDVTPEFKEKLEIVSAWERKYTDTFGDVISWDIEYIGMSQDEKIQTIQECLHTNKPKNIVLGSCYVPNDENETGILKNFKAFYF